MALSSGHCHPLPPLQVTAGPDAGKLALLDFGLVAEVPAADREAMISATIHLANRDWNGLITDFINLKFLPLNSNRYVQQQLKSCCRGLTAPSASWATLFYLSKAYVCFCAVLNLNFFFLQGTDCSCHGPRAQPLPARWRCKELQFSGPLSGQLTDLPVAFYSWRALHVLACLTAELPCPCRRIC